MNIWKRTEAKKKRGKKKEKTLERLLVWYRKYIACISVTDQRADPCECVCVSACALNFSSLSVPRSSTVYHLFSLSCPLFSLLSSLFFFFSPLLDANPACVGVDNKLGGEERLEEIREGWFLLGAPGQMAAWARPHTPAQAIVTAQGDSRGTVTLVGPIMRHDIPSSRGQKPLHLPLSLG